MQNLEPQPDVNSSGEHLFLLPESSYRRCNHQANQRLNWFKLGFSLGKLSDFRFHKPNKPFEVQTEKVGYLWEPVLWWVPKFNFHSPSPMRLPGILFSLSSLILFCFALLQIGKCLVDKIVHFPAHLVWPGSWPFRSLLFW